MDILELMHQRCSIRAYQPRAVEPDKIVQILEAAHVAPTAANRQPFRIVAVQEPGNLAKFRPLCKFREPPLVFIVCALPAEAWTRADGFNAAVVDASIVCDHMMLVATSLGLGSLWMTAFDVDGVKREFALPAGWEPAHLLCVGYAEDEPKSPERFVNDRRPLSDMVRWEV